MANSTLKGALAIHGGNPQFLIEKVIRARIYDSIYWKEECFALTAETIIDKALDLNCIGGVYANQKPTQFLSLTLKLLVLQPEKEICLEYLKAEEFKYLRALAAFYIRLTFKSVDVYEILEPLIKDYRKLRIREVGGFRLTYFDEFVDQLLTEERVCDVILPRLTKRQVLEETEGLAPRKSLLEDAMEGRSETSSQGGDRPSKRRRLSQSRSRSRSRSMSISPDRRRQGSISPDRSERYISPTPTNSSAYASEDDIGGGAEEGKLEEGIGVGVGVLVKIGRKGLGVGIKWVMVGGMSQEVQVEVRVEVLVRSRAWVCIVTKPWPSLLTIS